MSEDFLSDGEVRELLRDISTMDGGAGEETAVRDGRPQVLFISRRGGDARLLEDRLDAAGAVASHVRNPFTALDRIRRYPPSAVVSDLELWANEGALLLERLHALGLPVPVLFLTASSREDRGCLETRLRGRGAWGVLFQPVQARDAEVAARSLLAAVVDGPHVGPARARADAGVEAPSAPLAVGPVPEGEQDGRERSALLDAQLDVPLDAPLVSARDGELGWLRFHLHLTRAVRSPACRDDCAKKILDAASQDLAPRAVGIFFADGERAAARLEAAPGAPSSILDRLARSSTTAMAGSDEEGTSLVVHFGEAPAEGRMVLLGLPSASREAARAFLDDVRKVLSEGLGRS